MTNGRREIGAAALAGAVAMLLGAGGAGATPERRKPHKTRRSRCRRKTLGTRDNKRALLAGFASSEVGVIIEVKGGDLDAIRAVCNEATLASGECQAVAGTIQTSSVESYVDTLVRRIEANR